jgi:hypothetical protein
MIDITVTGQHIIPDVEAFRKAVLDNAHTRSEASVILAAAGLSEAGLSSRQASEALSLD